MRLTKADRETIRGCLHVAIANLKALENSSYESGRITKGGFPDLRAAYERVLAKLEVA